MEFRNQYNTPVTLYMYQVCPKPTEPGINFGIIFAGNLPVLFWSLHQTSFQIRDGQQRPKTPTTNNTRFLGQHVVLGWIAEPFDDCQCQSAKKDNKKNKKQLFKMSSGFFL